MKKTTVGVIFGGKSAEHEVSLQSAKNIIDAIDKDKYEVVLIGINKEGRWFLNDKSEYLLNTTNPKLIQLNKTENEVALIPGDKSNQLINIYNHQVLGEIDVIFPVLHGPYGEDGSVQGLMRLADLPYVGANILGSAVGMDKDVMKRLLRDAGIPIADFLTYNYRTITEITYEGIKNALGSPFFIKPANLGSSVGISKVHNQAEFKKAVEVAFQFDTKVVIEENIVGREIECSVLGNGNPMASVPGEVLPQGDFYSYEAKYIDEKGAVLDIPAKLPEDMVDKIQRYAIAAFKVLCCEGMARVDFFMQEDGHLIINEINTIPGFTRISMYPKLWEMSGVPYPELIDRLIQLAIDRYERESKLKTSL